MTGAMMAALASLALAAQPVQADEFCTGLHDGLSQPRGFDAYKRGQGTVDPAIGLTTWPSSVVLAGAGQCEVSYDQAYRDTVYVCDFKRSAQTEMVTFQAALVARAASCLPGVHAWHYDAGQKRVDYLQVSGGAVIIADNSTDHQTLTLMVQHTGT